MLNQFPNREFEALIRLLDDPDDHVYENVSSKLVSIGPNAIPMLEYEWESNINGQIQSRIENIIHQIEFDDCRSTLSGWTKNRSDKLLEGALIVSSYQFPEQDVDYLRNEIERLRKDVWLELNDHLTSLEKVRVLNHILFDVHEFSGNTRQLQSPQNSFLNNLLTHKRGNATALAILYKILSDELQLPIVAIDLPYHFILGFKDLNSASDDDILFYINPFSRGSVFGKGELERYMEKMELEMSVSELNCISNIGIVNRLLSELHLYYQHDGDSRRASEMSQLISVLGNCSKDNI